MVDGVLGDEVVADVVAVEGFIVGVVEGGVGRSSVVNVVVVSPGVEEGNDGDGVSVVDAAVFALFLNRNLALTAFNKSFLLLALMPKFPAHSGSSNLHFWPCLRGK